jgi:hypothetical protein
MREYFKPQFWCDYGMEVKDICLEFIKSKSSLEDLRLAQKKDMTYFITNIESLLESITKPEDKTEQVYQVSEMIELEMALRCLKMPILEKKLIGHSILVQKMFQIRNSI